MQQNAVSNPFSVAAYGDRPQMGLDVEFGADPASGAAFFQSDGRKHDDLKQMLDSNKDGLKLEAMKRIIGMIARGRDASDLFPAVVKNVVSKNIEVKKLVYVYLVRYAEEQQDLALLSISTFQRALKDPNQLIRASALRVLSSIRVSMIVPIVMLAIRDSAADLSPYVRKTAAHAIPKLYSLDPDQKDELVTVIEKLLSDRTTLVVGSAVMAFDEVCPERVDLIHKNYRKLCNLLVDVDEWGQVIIINMLTRYARTQFVDPNPDEEHGQIQDALDGQAAVNDERFYDESSNSSSEANEASSEEEGATAAATPATSTAKAKSKSSNNNSNSNDKDNDNNGGGGAGGGVGATGSYHIDLDHRLLLRQTKPLLQSRNASVVMAVAQLYHHVAPRNEVQLIAKALIRLLRSHKEVQSVVLNCIASMSARRKAIFEPHLKSFFVRTSDPTHLKLLKLDILTNLASASSISLILREFQTYISSSDRSFVAATIQAIGRCAASIKEVTETCLSGLVHLLSNHDEHVVAESVVVIKKLLQSKAAEHYEIITQMAKLIDYINVAAARAAIIWLIGEYNEKVPLIAPDVLRKMAKSFVDEQDVVKLQVLNLGVKLYLTNPEQTSLLCQYVFTLARYDTNYDVRDRARFLRQFIFPASAGSTVLTQHARQVFLASKPVPVPESKYRDGNVYQLSSLSHYLNMHATGYKELPVFPAVAPDPSVRNIAGYMQEKLPGDSPGRSKDSPKGDAKETREKGFLSESEKSSAYSETSDSDSSDGSSSSDSEPNDDQDQATQQKQNQNQKQKQPQAQAQPKAQSQTPKLDQVVTNPAASNTAAAAAAATAATGNNNNNNAVDDSGTSDSGESSFYSGSSDGDSSSSDSASDSEDEQQPRKSATVAEQAPNQDLEQPQLSQPQDQAQSQTQTQPAAKSNLDLLLDLDDIPPIGPVMTPSLGGFLTPGTPMMPGQAALQPQQAHNRIELVGPSHTDFKHKELLNKVSGHGLQLSYRFTRAPHLYSAAMCSIELQFQNRSDQELDNIRMGQQQLPSGMQLSEFAPIVQLLPQQMASGILGVDFNDTTHAIDFELVSSAGTVRVQLKPPVGELVRSVHIGESCHREERAKLRGMNEHQCELRGVQRELLDLVALKQKIYECINVAHTYSSATGQLHCFAGQTLSSKSLVLITLQWQTDDALTLLVNCEKMVIGSMVLNDLRNALQLSFAT
ncbi:AP-3 complex subunit beta-2 [Drosophila grimshawi]|uniref:GH12632 n=1 Tax=Drosophila grimshawi TaxID=7222 RepID=B4JKC1_DROGR|nr:AP-3 complex subunit beta-2 [Drosophila grimshawi]EDW00024.1 GH12632 [Drosophila grimshawi]